MQTFAHQQCFNHAAREAVARCPECRQFFCRECVTEHDDRMSLFGLPEKIDAPAELEQRFAFGRIVPTSRNVALGILIAWFFFFLIGESLLKLPDSFHEGTLWQAPLD
jgi:hypothetical protein